MPILNRTGAVLLLAVLAWFIPLNFHGLFEPDEGRYAEIPREMLVSGDWVTPRLDGLKYFEKPPLQYWATATAYRLFGPHEWTARLWPALTGFLGLVLTGALARRLYGRRIGWMAALVQAGALLYAALARITTLDMSLCFGLQCCLAGMLLLVQEPPAAEAAGRRAAPWLLALGVVIGTLSKGLVGLLIPGAVAALYLLWYRRFALLWRAKPWLTLLALLVLVVPWFALVSLRNPEFAHFFFIHEHFERYLTRVHDRYEPVWYFAPLLLVGLLPWTSLLPALCRRTWQELRAGDQVVALLSLWSVFIFAFFSLSDSKLPPYILPMVPALSLMLARTAAQMERNTLARHWIGCALAGAVLTLASALLVWLPQAQPLRTELGAPGLAGLIIGFLAFATFSLAAALLCQRRGALPAVLCMSLGSLALVESLLAAAPQVPSRRGFPEMAALVRPTLHADTAFYCVKDYLQPVIFYLGRTCVLVGYRGELDFGLTQQPQRYLPDLAAFATQWAREREAIALLRPGVLEQLRDMGVPLRVLYTAPSFVMVARQ